MFLSVGASTEAKALHVCSVGSVSTRHAVVCVFLAFIKITISPLTLAYYPYPALLYSTTTALYPTPPLLHSTLYSTATALDSIPTPLYPTALAQPQLHPTLLHPYSTLPLLHLARHLRRRAPQLRTLHTHSMTHLTAVRCFHPALLHCYTAALSLCTLPAGPL